MLSTPLKRGARCVALVGHTAQMGGAEHALVRLVECMDRRRWHPVLVFAEEGPVVDVFRAMSAEVYVIAAAQAMAQSRRETLSHGGCLNARRVAGLVRHVARIGRFLRERGVELVHTNSLKAHVYAGIAARICRIPLVWHLRDSIDESYLPTGSVRGMRWLGRILPQNIVAVSRSVARHVAGEAHAAHCTVVYDGLRESDLVQWAEPGGGAVSSRSEPGGWVVGMVGRLTRWKGQHVFLEAAARLLQCGLNVRFEILGEALFGEESYKRELQAQTRDLGLEERVQYCGAVNDVARRIQRWNVLVHASVSPDPCPNVVLEAMAAGVPVVGSDGGGVPEILEEGRFGWLHPMGDSRALADVLETILRNPQKAEAMASEARVHAGIFFTASRVAREVEACWEQLISPHPWKKRLWPEIEEERQRPCSGSV